MEIEINGMKINEIIEASSIENGDANVAVNYYQGQHDIYDRAVVFVNDEGQMVNDIYSENYTIATPFLTDIVRQSTNNIFHEPLQFKTDEESLEKILKEYITNETHRVLYEMVEEASKKGWEWVYVYRDEVTGLPSFMNVDGRQVYQMKDDYGNTTHVIRHFVGHVEVWDTEGNYSKYKLDDDTKKYFQVTGDDVEEVYTFTDEQTGELISGFGKMPWFKLVNNKEESSDLNLIKDFIDSYDIMNTLATNYMHDFKGTVYVLKGAAKEDLGRLRKNISSQGAVKVGKNAEVEVKQIELSIQGYKEKMRIDRQNIYSVAQGFDGDILNNASGNVTNDALRVGERRLISKTKQKVTYLNLLIDWMLEIILDDIKRRGLGEFTVDDIEVVYTHSILEDNKSNEEASKLKAERKQTQVNTILSLRGVVADEVILGLLGDVLGVSLEGASEMMELQDYGLEALDTEAEVGAEEDEEAEPVL